jgi:hypothetical protein
MRQDDLLDYLPDLSRELHDKADEADWNGNFKMADSFRRMAKDADNKIARGITYEPKF